MSSKKTKFCFECIITKWGRKLLQSRTAFSITKWGRNYYKVGQLIYYKAGQNLLQSGVGITK